MKIISDISLKDFGFWSGAKDTAEQLTDEQFDQVEGVLEDLYPDGMTDTELNDIFWFESDKVYEWAGCFPKFFKLTATCGRVKYVRANNADEQQEIEDNVSWNKEVDENECNNIVDFDDIDLDEFNKTHYFRIISRHIKNEMIVFCQGDDAAKDLKEQFSMCKVEEIEKVDEDGIEGEEDWEDWEDDSSLIDEFAYDEEEMYGSYDIPVYAIPRICKLVLDPNDELDCYEVPESHAINMLNLHTSLNDEEIHNIDSFLTDLYRSMPSGFTIDWDVESIGSPYIEPFPAFGKAVECVKLRVYPNETDTRRDN